MKTLKNHFMRILIASIFQSFCFFILIFSFSCTSRSGQELEWVQLFNGKDLKDWQIKIRHYPLHENYGNTFRVEDGILKIRYDEYENFDNKFGHIFYKQPFSYYLVAAEYRFVGEQAPGGPGWAYRNNGLMLHGQDPATMSIDQDFPQSIEVQLLGGNGVDARSTANLCTPGTSVIIDNKFLEAHCTNSRSLTYHGDQWVRVEVLVLGDSVIQHFVNGEQVMSYIKPQKGETEGGELIRSGTISLQGESHPTDFRKIEIVDLERYRNDPKKLKEAIQILTADKRIALQD
jgi:hypothetical protein